MASLINVHCNFNFTFKNLIRRTDTLSTITLQPRLIKLAKLKSTLLIGTNNGSLRLVLDSLFDHPFRGSQEVACTFSECTFLASNINLTTIFAQMCLTTACHDAAEGGTGN